MNNKKPVVVILIVLTTICLGLGVIGFLQSRKGSTTPKPAREYYITYKYYLNDVEVGQKPTNPTLISDEGSSNKTTDVEKLYAFDHYTCTNNVTGSFDEASWEFKHSNTADSTCHLYFVTTYNTLKVKVTNAKLVKSTDAEMKISRGAEALVKITPNEGYIYKATTCTNNENALWNADANELIIESIVKETSCEVEFELSKFTLEIEVSNGTGTTKVEYDYGKKIETTVTPADSYGNPKITCTNDQKATWKNNTLTIDKLTDNSKCTVEFEKINIPVNFSATLDVGTHGTLALGKSTVSVISGGSTSWSVNVSTGYAIDSITCTAGKSMVTGSNPYTVKLEDITSDAECIINYKEATVAPPEQGSTNE